jgi:hypothetical protein
VRADSGKGIPAISELSKCGSAPDGMQNMWWLYMDPRLYKADRRRQWHALRHNGADASGRRADGAEVGNHSFLVDDVAALSILLIIHYERHRGGGCEESCIAGGRAGAKFGPAKKNVADTKLHGVYRKRYVGFGGRVTHPEGIKEVG